ncbi:MAG TPA: sigma-70 family RNA polymerase sigma factor [Gemmataceae bacterium]|nr:sigma-70 family RNA polymerase sigma factor [Gemmataceae bacterium]
MTRQPEDRAECEDRQNAKPWPPESVGYQADWTAALGGCWALVGQSSRAGGLQEADREDVMQEVALAVVQLHAALAGAAALESRPGWLHGTVRHKIADAQRAHAHQPATNVDMEAIAAKAHPAKEPLSEAEVLQRAGLSPALVKRVRGCFGKRAWRAFLDVAVHGRAAADVGEELGMSVDAVYQAVHRIRMKFQRECRKIQPSLGRTAEGGA